MKARTTRKAARSKPATRQSAPAIRHARPTRPGPVRPIRKLSSPHPSAARVSDPGLAILQATGAGPSTGTPIGSAASRMAPRFPEDDYDYTYLHDFLGQSFVPGACRAVVFGCGKGEEAVHLSERGYRVTGLDADRNSVGLARERAWLNSRDVDFMIGDVFESANLLPAESFGLASDRGVFRAIARNQAATGAAKKSSHRSGDGSPVPDDDRDRRKFLDLVRRLLLPGGVFLLNATEVDPARKGRAPRKRGRARGQNDLLVQEGGEVMGEVLRAGLEIVGRRLYPVPGPANTAGTGDGDGAPCPASPATGKQILLLYCRK